MMDRRRNHQRRREDRLPDAEKTDAVATIARPVVLRWSDPGAAQHVEAFASVDAAIDAIQQRWRWLKDLAPHVTDGGGLVLFSTKSLREINDFPADDP